MREISVLTEKGKTMRPIDADVLIDDIENSRGRNSIYAQFVRAWVKEAPTVDAVPVVRCKDCRHWCEMQNLTGACLRLCAIDGALWMGTDATDFCSFAERKDDE